MPRPRQSTLSKVTTGIYQDETQWYATMHVRGAGFREARFPLAVKIEDVQAWRERTRVALLGTAERGSLPGTFERDAKQYLKAFTQHLASRKTRALETQRWIEHFGTRPRGTIRPADVARVRSRWLSQGTSPKTINNRVGTLRHLYHCLDGRRAWTPCDDLTDLPVHKSPMRFVSDAVILAVDAKLQQLERERHIRSQKPRARFRVLVSTGRRPSEVMRTEPGDLDLERRIWLPRDGKGGYSPGLYLNDDMLAAWQCFIAAKAWGYYDTEAQAAILRRAGWPADIKPYHARHTVGITLSEKGVDLDDIGPMMGHKRRETTRKHYVPVLHSRLQKASEALEGRFHGWTVQTALQTTVTPRGKNRRKLAAKKTARKRPSTSESRGKSAGTRKRR